MKIRELLLAVITTFILASLLFGNIAAAKPFIHVPPVRATSFGLYVDGSYVKDLPGTISDAALETRYLNYDVADPDLSLNWAVPHDFSITAKYVNTTWGLNCESPLSQALQLVAPQCPQVAPDIQLVDNPVTP